MNLLEYAYTQNGAGKRFLADLFDAATVNEDWFSAISSTNDPRTEWCGYPACEDNQLHGREHQNWQQLVPVNTNDCDTGWLSCYLNFFILSTAYIMCEHQDLLPWCNLYSSYAASVSSQIGALHAERQTSSQGACYLLLEPRARWTLRQRCTWDHSVDGRVDLLLGSVFEFAISLVRFTSRCCHGDTSKCCHHWTTQILTQTLCCWGHQNWQQLVPRKDM